MRNKSESKIEKAWECVGRRVVRTFLIEECMQLERFRERDTNNTKRPRVHLFKENCVSERHTPFTDERYLY